MPLRPELPPGLGLPRRGEMVRLPRLNFPMIGGAPEYARAQDGTRGPAGVQEPAKAGGPVGVQEPPGVEEPVQPLPPSPLGGESSTVKLEEGSVVEPMNSIQPPASSANPVASRECNRVIVFGKAGNPECLEAIQDLIDRQVCFTYHDVTRDEKAKLQLQAIVGDNATLPVIIQIGARGG